MQKIGLFCGTFNPIHIGHLIIAECSRAQFQLEKVIFVTSPNPPHRNEELLDASARHELVEAAVADNPFFQASKIELERKGPSYTIDTVKQIATKYGEVEIYLIIGGDNLSQLKTWKNIEELVKLCHIAVAPRLRFTDETDLSDAVPSPGVLSPAASQIGGSKIVQKGNTGSAELEMKLVGEDSSQPDIGLIGAKITVVDFPGIAVSGSTIRRRIKEGKTVLYMVPPAVNRIIESRGLFKVQSRSVSGTG